MPAKRARRANAYPDGDPFNSVTMHAQVRRTFKALALSNERNAAWALQLALADSETRMRRWPTYRGAQRPA
jgi:hypothetical protein